MANLMEKIEALSAALKYAAQFDRKAGHWKVVNRYTAALMLKEAGAKIVGLKEDQLTGDEVFIWTHQVIGEVKMVLADEFDGNVWEEKSEIYLVRNDPDAWNKI